MRPKIVWTIFKKEITEALRDRVTLSVVILLPLLLYPLLITGMSKMQKSDAASASKRVSRIAVWGDAPPRLLQWLERTNVFAIKTEVGLTDEARAALNKLEFRNEEIQTNAVANGTAPTNAPAEQPLIAAARKIVSDKKADAVLVVLPGFTDAMKEHGLGRAFIYYDSVRSSSQQARFRLVDELHDLRRALITEREQKHGLLEGFSRAIEMRSEDVATKQRKAGEALSNVLPLILILLSAMGALYAAIDLTAGEKDRMTMQTLLCAPVLSIEIVAGKFLTVWVISLIAALANAVSLSLTISRVAASMGGLSLSPSVIALVFPCLLLVTCTIAAVFLAVAVLARDAKDAGHFLSAAFTLLVAPMSVSLMPGIELNAVTSFLPLVNIALLIKALFIGEAQADLIFLALLAALAYATLALLFAARVFSREQVLLGGKGGVRSLFRFERKPNEFPTPSTSLVLFIVVLVAMFYCSIAVERISLVPAVLINLYGTLLLPVIVWTAIRKFPLRETFALRAPHWRSVIGAVLIGATGAIGVAGLVARILPPPESLVEDMQKLLLLGNPPAPLWIALFVLAISPALCEELLFRGFIFRGFQKLGAWPAIFVSALLFGIAHASIYRLLPTLGLGLLMGYTVWKSRSIYCSMLIHALNNGLVVAYVHWQAKRGEAKIPDLTMIPWGITFGALALTILGLLLLRAPNEKSEWQTEAAR